MQHVDTIPGSIVAAICRVQASLASVAKSQRNQHGGYQFASTDDIYAALTRKLGEVGLAIVPLELHHEIVRVEKEGKTSQWLKAEFGFVLATEQATWTHPAARRSLYIQVTGPQTHQAAQSYAEKAFLRSLFKLPTGDLDLDSLPQSDTEEGQVALAAPRKPKSSSKAKKDGTSEVFNEIVRHIQHAATLEVLEQIPELYAEEISTLPQRWHDLYEGEYETRLLELRGRVQEAAE